MSRTVVQTEAELGYPVQEVIGVRCVELSCNGAKGLTFDDQVVSQHLLPMSALLAVPRADKDVIGLKSHA